MLYRYLIFGWEEVLHVEIPVLVVDGVVEGDHDHLHNKQQWYTEILKEMFTGILSDGVEPISL